MRANVFRDVNRFGIEVVPRRSPGVDEAIFRLTLTICRTDLQYARGECPVNPGLTIGHEPVGVVEQLRESVKGYLFGDRVLVGAITPCGQCSACLSEHLSQWGHGGGFAAIGG